ncbi:MAG: RDD family protein [Sphingomonadales bacterium]|nr:RDD family protein [Sphingomonadaceae bacterium]MBS3930262.1 RDD family protein [Sphingomonadales bacterium]
MSQVRPKRSDRRRTLVTPEGIALPLVLASRGTRFGALLIDLVIILVLMTVVTLAALYSGIGLLELVGKEFDKAEGSLKYSLEFLVILYIAVMFLFRHAYFLFFELGPRGSTPGKRATGIRVAARHGGRLTTEMVLARNLLRDVEIVLPLVALITAASEGGIYSFVSLLWFGVFALFPFFNRDRLRAGDLVAGTWVVEAPKSKLEVALSTTESAASGTSTATGASYKFGEEELAIYGEYELQTLERVLREDRHEAMVAVHEAICRKIGWNPGAGDERAFLEAYYTQLRARLESGMRMGKRKADKHA